MFPMATRFSFSLVLASGLFYALFLFASFVLTLFGVWLLLHSLAYINITDGANKGNILSVECGVVKRTRYTTCVKSRVLTH